MKVLTYYVLILATLATLARADDVFFPQIGTCTVIGGNCGIVNVTGSAPHQVLRITEPGCTLQCEFMVPDNVDFDADDAAGGLIAEIPAAPGAATGSGPFCWSWSVGAVADHEDITAVNYDAASETIQVDLNNLALHVQAISETLTPIIPHSVSGLTCTNAACRARKAYLRLAAPACPTPLATPQVVDVDWVRVHYNPNPAATLTPTP